MNKLKELKATFNESDFLSLLQAYSRTCSRAISKDCGFSPGRRNVAMKKLLAMYALKNEHPEISPKARFLLPLASVSFHQDYAPIYIKVATEIEKHGIKLTEALYGTLLNAFTKLKNKARLDWLEEKKQASITITSIKPYHSVIRDLLRDNKQIEAYELLQKCKADGLALDSVVYNILMRHFNSQGLYTRSLDMYEEMMSEGVKPNTRTFQHIFFLLDSTGLFNDQFETVYKEMKSLKIHPDSSIGAKVAHTLIELKDLRKLEWWIKELRDASVRFDSYLVNAWLSGYVESGDTGRMKQILAEGFKPNGLTIELMELAKSNERDPENAQRVDWGWLARKAGAKQKGSIQRRNQRSKDLKKKRRESEAG